MKIQINFTKPGFADCDISIRAKGSIMAMICWATESSPLQGWSSLATIPIDPAGTGTYSFRGQYSIPEGVTHVYVKTVTYDFTSVNEAYYEIPEKYRTKSIGVQKNAAFSVMSDLHLSGKPGRIIRALNQAENDVILMPGDLTNDGFTEQFRLFRECIEGTAGNKLILAVTGNHDQLFDPSPEILETYEGYSDFQRYLFGRADKLGYHVEEDFSGAYSVDVNGIDVIGLQCVSAYRKFVFQDGDQLKWLDKHLKESDSKWHIIMCHAPLLAHNPHRNDGTPYFTRDKELQKIIDDYPHIIFISGHTHISPNHQKSCVEYDTKNQTLYINDGSVTPTELSGEVLMPSDWKDGVIMELAIYEDIVEVKAQSIHTGIYYPRGYYRFNRIK